MKGGIQLEAAMIRHVPKPKLLGFGFWGFGFWSVLGLVLGFGFWVFS